MFKLKVPRPKDLTKALAGAKSEATKRNLSFIGDEEGGRGSGYGFDVSYEVQGDSVAITFHKKPFIISESKIKNTVDKFVAGYLRNER